MVQNKTMRKRGNLCRAAAREGWPKKGPSSERANRAEVIVARTIRIFGTPKFSNVPVNLSILNAL